MEFHIYEHLGAPPWNSMKLDLITSSLDLIHLDLIRSSYMEFHIGYIEFIEKLVRKGSQKKLSGIFFRSSQGVTKVFIG